MAKRIKFKPLIWLVIFGMILVGYQNCSDVKFKEKALKVESTPTPQVETKTIDPPIIITHPVGGGTYQQDFTMYVEVKGDDLSYQWLRDGASLSGQVGMVLQLSSLLESSNGVYTIQVTNEGGSVTSNPAVIIVHKPEEEQEEEQETAVKTYASCTGKKSGNCTLGSVNHGGVSGLCTYGGSCNFSCNDGVWVSNSNNCAGPASCAGTTFGSNPLRCRVTTKSSGGTSGSCEFEGSCSYKCSNGNWQPVSNSCDGARNNGENG